METETFQLEHWCCKGKIVINFGILLIALATCAQLVGKTNS